MAICRKISENNEMLMAKKGERMKMAAAKKGES
jgi:hypothetical protein